MVRQEIKNSLKTFFNQTFRLIHAIGAIPIFALLWFSKTLRTAWSNTALHFFCVLDESYIYIYTHTNQFWQLHHCDKQLSRPRNLITCTFEKPSCKSTAVSSKKVNKFIFHGVLPNAMDITRFTGAEFFAETCSEMSLLLWTCDDVPRALLHGAPAEDVFMVLINFNCCLLRYIWWSNRICALEWMMRSRFEITVNKLKL